MPDLNTVPPSPRPLGASSRPTSRRQSQQMAPPTLPLSSPALNILPSNQSTVNPQVQPIVAPGASVVIQSTAIGITGDNTGVGAGPGPLRHPRPLTAADLHLQLEKEQEAVVNRLTRELSLLRAAQNASVVSNSSSTSAGLPDSADHNANHLLSGPSHPTPSQRRHHRSSSSTSTRSNVAATLSGISNIIPSSTADRARAGISRHDSNSQAPISMSRQNSVTSSRRSGASSPAPPGANPGSYTLVDYLPYGQSQRPTIPAREPSNPNIPQPDVERQLSNISVTSVPTTGRYEETAFHRHELEAVKRENEALKRRIRELERTLRERRQSDASRTRSESVSTTASVGTGAGRGRERDMDEDDVRVGESARGGGLR